MSLIYTERLSVLLLLRSALAGTRIYYMQPTRVVRTLLARMVRAGKAPSVTQLTIGHVDVLTGIRRRAYERARMAIESIGETTWSRDMARFLGIDFLLIVRKQCFDDLYRRYEFYEVARQHNRQAGREAPPPLHFDFADSGVYRYELADEFRLVSQPRSLAGAALMLLVLPLVVVVYARGNSGEGTKHFERSLVFEIDGAKLQDMFTGIFGDLAHHFVVEPRNRGDANWCSDNGISVLGLQPAERLQMLRAAFVYVWLALCSPRVILRLRDCLFDIFYVVLRGRAEAISGGGNTLITYEHPTTLKAVRNEFIRREGSRSVYIPMNANDTPIYFHEEIFMNYDVMCLAGKHSMELYRIKEVLTPSLIPVGTHDAHRGPRRPEGREERIQRLRAFKGNGVLLVFTVPGICGPTLINETKLMALAKALSNHPRIRIVVRQKPVEPPPEFRTFYEDALNGVPNVLLTAGEHELWDFVDVADLVVSSISTSAFDLAVAGAQVVFVDFQRDPELFLSWVKVPEVVITSEDAEQRIRAWIDGEPGGAVRRAHARNVARLADAIDFQYRDFSAYRAKVLRVFNVDAA